MVLMDQQFLTLLHGKTYPKKSCNGQLDNLTTSTDSNLSKKIVSTKKWESKSINLIIFGIVVLILIVLTLHGFFVEYRISILKRKLNEINTNKKILKDEVNELLIKINKLEYSIRPTNRRKVKFMPDPSLPITRKRQTVITSNDGGDGRKVHLPCIHMESNSNGDTFTQFETKSLNFWKESNWVSRYLKKNIFYLDVSSGRVVVEEEGVYLVYVQVVYNDEVGRWSAGIVVNEEVKAKCLESEQLSDKENYIPDKQGIYKQCSLTTVVYLRPKQNVSIKSMYGLRTILSQPEFTYWGMLKLT